MPYLWVPAGLLENGGELEIVAISVSPRKRLGTRFRLRGCLDAAPDLAEFIATLSDEGAG
jgi:hypothetical protein